MELSALIVTSVLAFVGVLISVFAILESHRVEQIRMFKDNTDDLLEKIADIQEYCNDSKVEYLNKEVKKMTFREDNEDDIPDELLKYIDDMVAKIKRVKVRAISHFTAFLSDDEKKDTMVKACISHIEGYTDSYTMFYRTMAHFVAELVCVKAKGNALEYRDLAIELGDTLHEAMIRERKFNTFLIILATEVRRQIEKMRHFWLFKKVDYFYIFNRISRERKISDEAEQYVDGIVDNRREIYFLYLEAFHNKYCKSKTKAADLKKFNKLNEKEFPAKP